MSKTVSPAPALILAALMFSTQLSPVWAGEAVEVTLNNPTFTNVEEGVPADWKPYPPPNGEATKIEALPEGGGIRLTDSDSGNGLGLGQWVPVEPGHEYQVTLVSGGMEGGGGLFVGLTFTPKVPTKMAQINQIKLGEERKWVNPGETAVITATAPQGSTQGWLLIYSPKANDKPCDINLVSIKMEDLGGSAENAPAPMENKDDPAMKARPAAETLPAGTLKVVDFETGDLSQVRTTEGGKLQVVSAPEHPVRHGKYAMRPTLTHSDHRSEMTSFRSAPYGEVKYGWSVYLPDEFDGESWFSIVTQWHTWGSGRDYAMKKPGPPTCLTISNNKWHLKLIHQAEAGTFKADEKFFDISSIEGDRGKWTDYVMEVNWQSPTTGGGYLRLFKNGEQVIDYTGPTWFDGKHAGPFFKMGVYKGSGTWKGEEAGAVLYFDEFRMTDAADATKDSVDPAKLK